MTAAYHVIGAPDDTGADPDLSMLDSALTALYDVENPDTGPLPYPAADPSDIGLKTVAPPAPVPSTATDPVPTLALPAGPNVTIDVIAKDGDGAALLLELQSIGLFNGASFHGVASGELPIADIGLLIELQDLQFASETHSAVAAAIPPQAAEALNAQTVQTSFSGAGIKVGIISDSFDMSGGADTMATDIANGYLPADTQILSDTVGGDDEGRAMAEIVHEIAPGASILFDAGGAGQATFAQHILDLAAAGAKVIVDDYYFPDEPAYQDGVIAQAIQQVESEGVVYLSAAGNDGGNGYEGPFAASSSTFIYNGRQETLDAFAPGETRLPVVLSGVNGTIEFVLQWNQPAASVHAGTGATSDLDLFFTDANGNVLSGLAATSSNIGGDPVEVLTVDTNGASGTYYLEVGLEAGAAPTDLRIIGDDDGGGVAQIQQPAGSIGDSTLFGHSAVQGGGAVGAADYTGTPAFGATPPVSEQFSAAGPDTIEFDANGNPLATPDIRTITFTGVDGVDTSFFGDSSADTDGDGLPNFFGTSAAAPSVAAVAAMMLEANSNLTPADVNHLLADSAIAMTDPAVSGAGLVQADKAVDFAHTDTITAFAGGNTTLLGTHLADTIIGGTEADVITGYGGGDALTGGGGADVFRDTAADFNGSAITDLNSADTIDITNLASANATYGISGHTLTVDSHTGTTTQIALPQSLSSPVFVLSSDNGSGTDLVLNGSAPPDNAPVAQAGSASGDEDTIITGTVAATDADSDPLTYSVVATTAHGSLTLNADGTFSYTPDANYNGADSFTFKANDGTLDSNVATESLTIAAVNDPPVLSHFGNTPDMATEQTFIKFNPLATVTDTELDALNSGAGDYAGASVIIGRSGGADTDDTYGFNTSGALFTVDSTHHTLLSGGQVFATYLVPSTGPTEGTIGINFTSQDTPATTTLVDDVLQHITYKNLNDAPPASVNMLVTFHDGNTGAEGSGGDGIDTAHRTVDIASVDDAPVAQDGSVSGNENTVITGSLSASDVDGPSLAYLDVTQPAHGSLTIDATHGTFIYTPDADYSGPDSFTFKANDGTLDSNVATETLTINSVSAPTDHAPTDIALSPADVNENSPDGTVIGMLSDTDPDSGDTATFSLLDDAGGRFAIDGDHVVVLNGLLLDYEQNPSHTIDVQVTDSGGLTFDKDLTITVDDVNPEIVSGTDGPDQIDGGPLADSINGGPGNDVIFGGAGDDMLGGGPGDDTISGGDGNDTIWGEDGHNVLGGNAGNDTIIGGPSSDIIGGDDGNDVLVGGDGNDTMFGGTGDDQISGGGGDDVIVGDDGNDTIWGGDGNDTINAGAGNDLVLGGNGNDQIGGGAGDDDLRGEAGNDTLWGEDGNDTLTGGPGDDVLIGGAGSDTFVFRPSDGHDIITDFTPAGPQADHIWLAGTDLHSFADVLAHASFNPATGATTITHNGADTIVLNGVAVTSLIAADFFFS